MGNGNIQQLRTPDRTRNVSDFSNVGNARDADDLGSVDDLAFADTFGSVGPVSAGGGRSNSRQYEVDLGAQSSASGATFLLQPLENLEELLAEVEHGIDDRSAVEISKSMAFVPDQPGDVEDTAYRRQTFGEIFPDHTVRLNCVLSSVARSHFVAFAGCEDPTNCSRCLVA